MDSESVFALLLGIGLGAFLCWLFLKEKANSAFKQGRAELAIELATSQERVRSMEGELANLTDRLQELKESERVSQMALNRANDELATLNERTSRIPTLESKIAELSASLTEASRTESLLNRTNAGMASELKAVNDLVAQLQTAYQREKAAREIAQSAHAQLNAEYADLNARFISESKQAESQLKTVLDAREELSNQFKTLANEILEEKSKRFTEQNQTNISQILSPLKERIAEFKTKVEEIHGKEIEQQALLKAELGQLKELNQKMTEEAHDLATALKGQVKKQGNWGELILGNVLDRSGLRDGKDYKKELSFTTEEGRKRPDVVIYLPQSKHLVVDAKVSLNAYTRYVNAENDLDRQQALKEHVGAISSRIQELSDRSYFELPGLNSPEMVFMFIPIESAFVEALRADETLFQRAIEQNVLVATPTTLLTSLNIVRQLWRFEEQNVHTAELADKASKVYKKLVTFLNSMDAVGKQLDRARESYATAMGQLYTGKGNLIAQAKDFERLGVSIQSPLPEHLVSKAVLELDILPAAEPASVDLNNVN